MSVMKRIFCILLSAAAVVYTWITHQISEWNSSDSDVQMIDLNNDLKDLSHDDVFSSTYEIFVYSFCDSDQDGIGDLNGVTKKLDYIKGLGFHAIWLMPVAQSPSYHKYDVTDYCSIDEEYGTIEDFDHLVEEASARGIKVITDLVLNHTSDQHPWFEEAGAYLRSTGDGEPDVNECPYVDYYHFSRYAQEGYEKLPDSDWYYEAQFTGSMPDLNLDSEAVRNEVKEIMRFWIEHGVSGFRLDAVTSYYTGDDQANTEFLEWLTSAGKEMKSDLYFTGEAWTSRDVYASYYAGGIDSLFDFSFASDSGVISKTVNGQTGADQYVYECIEAEELYASYNAESVNAPFYTNHDMNRSASYYAEGDTAKVKMAEALNLLMSGNAFLYYGEELGMNGEGSDENKRAPMYWSDRADDEDLCAAAEGMDDIEMYYGSYEEQKDDPLSVYSYVKQVMKIRNAFPAVCEGKTYIEESLSGHDLAVMFKVSERDEDVMIVINTSSVIQETDLSGIGKLDLRAVLNTGEDNVCFDEGVLTIPAYAIAVFTENEG